MITKKILITVLSLLIGPKVFLLAQVEELVPAANISSNVIALVATRACQSSPFAQALVDQAARLFAGTITLYYNYDMASYLGLLDEAVRLNLYDACKDSQARGYFALKNFLVVAMSPEALAQYMRTSVVLACQDEQYKNLDGCPTFRSEADVNDYVNWLINHSSKAFYLGCKEMTLLQYATRFSSPSVAEACIALGANPVLWTQDVQMCPADLNNSLRDDALALHQRFDILFGNNVPVSTEKHLFSVN